MARFRVLLTDYAWPDLAIERSAYEAAGVELIVAPDGGEATLASLAGAVDAIQTCWARVTRRVLDAAPGLRVVSRLGIGLDNIDVAACTERRVPVTNVPDYCLHEVAEHALALLMALARNVAIYHAETKAGRYRLQAGPPLRRLSGRTLGIVGLGNIGRALADRAVGLGLRVLATTRTPRPHPGVEFRSLDELLAESDFVSLHLPLLPETRRLIGAEQLARMRPTACLINTARGGLIDHEALAEALEAGRLAGAALDVQDPEPPDLSRPPYSHPRTIVTPHAAFVSEESLAELRRRAVRQVIDVLEGRRPEHVVNGV